MNTTSPPIIKFDESSVERMPSAVVEFVARAIENMEDDSLHDNRRAHPRYGLAHAVIAMPVDDNCKPAGGCFEAFGRDLSVGGMAIVHTRAVRVSLLALQISLPNGRKPIKMIGKVTRCRPLGRFYDIGIQFVAKIVD
ncbi:MAG: PilZ domain-containing protein [Planctomycetota bacterium]